MDAAIIELDALADAVGATAEDDDFLAVGGWRFAFRFVAAVKVGRVRLKLSGAGVHLVIGGEDAQAFAQSADVELGDWGLGIGDWGVGRG